MEEKELDWLKVGIDELGTIRAIEYLDGRPLVYDKDESKRIDDGSAKIASGACCWRHIRCRWYCRPEYC